MSCRDEILICARKLFHQSGRDVFHISDILDEMNRLGTIYPESTIRTHVTSRMCANAPKNHPHKYNDLIRVARGKYKLNEIRNFSQIENEGNQSINDSVEPNQIVLISCVSKKLSRKAPARDLYISPLFRLNFQYATKLAPSKIYILSAKYGLVNIEDEIEPYNVTLINMSASERKKWATKVLVQLSECSDLRRDHFIFLAGNKYRQYLIPKLKSYDVPMQGLPIGKQLQFLKRKVTSE